MTILDRGAGLAVTRIWQATKTFYCLVSAGETKYHPVAVKILIGIPR